MTKYELTATAKLENWSIVRWTGAKAAPEDAISPPGARLTGECYEHPNPMIFQGEIVQTSTLLEINVELQYARTLNTVYALGQMHPDYKRFLDQRRVQ